MKKNQLFFALLGSLLSFSSAFAQVSGTNVAQGATVLCTNEGGDTKDGSNMTDGDTNSTVEFGRTGDNNGVGIPNKVNNGETQQEATVANAKVTLNNYYDLSEIQIYFAGYAPVKYCIKVSKDDVDYTTVYTSSAESTDNQWEKPSISAESMKGVKFIKFCPLVSKNYKITIVGEIQAAGTVVSHTSTSVSSIVLSSSATSIYKGRTVSFSSIVKDQDGYIYEGNPTLTWSVKKDGETATNEDYSEANGEFTFNAAGTYTITQESGTTTSNEITVTVAENIAQGKTIAASAGFKNPSNAVDGNWESPAGGDNDPTTGYLTIDLGAIYNLNTVTVNWNPDAYAKTYTIEVGRTTANLTQVASETDKASWTTLPKDYTFENQEARYIKLSYSALSNDGWGAQLRELAAKGTEVVHNDAKLTSITVLPAASQAYVGESVTLTPAYNDQYGGSATVSNVVWAVTPADGASVTADGVFTSTKAGTYTVTVTATDATDSNVTKTSNEVAITTTVDPNIAKGASVTMTNEDETTRNDGYKLTDGDTSTSTEVDITTDDASESTKANALVDLGGHYDLSNFTVYFDNSDYSPKKFKVSVSSNNETYTDIKTTTRDNFGGTLEFNYEATGDNMKNVRYIKLSVLTGFQNATRIAEIKAFGTLAAADKMSKTTAGGIDTYTGVWVEENFDKTSTSGEIDLTSVASLPNAIDATANENALLYVSASAPATLKAQANVVVVDGDNYTMKSLVVTDGKPLSFTKATDAGKKISVQEGTVKRNIAKDAIAAIYLPFGIKNGGAVMTYYPQGSLQTEEGQTKLSFGTNGENGTLSAYIPAVLVAQEAIAELKSAGAFTLEVKDGDFESVMGASRTFDVITEVDGAYGLRESTGVFVAMSKAKNNKVNPFHSYIVKQEESGANARIVLDLDGTVTAITGIDAQGNMQAGAIYNMAGQRVSNSYKGIVIKNGKKYLSK